MSRRSLRMFRVLLWGLVLLAGLGSSWLFLRPQPGPVPQPAEAGIGQGGYRLVTDDGQPFTQASLRGRPSLVFFGFTQCPDVCPTTLGDIAGWKAALGAAGRDLRVFFVTVDPERDTPAVLRAYVGWIPEAQGVTGTAEEVQDAARAFHIQASRVPLPDGGYTMNHTAQVLLFGRDGRLVRRFGYQAPAGQVLPQLRAALAG